MMTFNTDFHYAAQNGKVETHLASNGSQQGTPTLVLRAQRSETFRCVPAQTHQAGAAKLVLHRPVN